MSEVVAGLDVLAEQYPTFGARLSITLLAFAVVSVVSWGVTRLRQRTGDGLQSAVADLVGSLAIACSLLGATGATIGVWGQASTVAFVLDQANIGPEALGRVLLTIGLLIGTFVFVRFLKGLISELLGGRDAVSEHEIEIAYRISQVAIYILAFLVVLGFWQVNLSGLLIGAGVLGAVIGFAAQDTLASIFAGFVLMFSRPFEIGDWVEIGDQEGIVSDITIISTRIQTFDGEYMIVPNNEVSSRTINNRSKKGRLRLRVSVGVDYDTDLDRAEAVIRETISDLDQLMRVPTPQIVVTGFEDSAISFEIRFWIDKPSARRRWRAKQSVIKAVTEAFRREGITIPYPQRELSGRDDESEVLHDAREATAQTDGSGDAER